MTARPIEGGKATLALLPDGILHLAWDRDCTITVEDAEAAMAAVNGLADGGGHPMLVDMETTRTVTRGARAVFAIPCAASRIALLGSSRGQDDRQLLPRRELPALPHPVLHLTAPGGRLAAERGARAPGERLTQPRWTASSDVVNSSLGTLIRTQEIGDASASAIAAARNTTE
ncbi:hypothetical protein QFZ50_003095 [Arthrobacter agilis]|nr:hypothetical protein [Arthrobacter agilis]